jgi:hypothetical protein
MTTLQVFENAKAMRLTRLNCTEPVVEFGRLSQWFRSDFQLPRPRPVVATIE